MGDSEREFSEKIAKIKLKSSEKVTEVLDQFGKAQKMKAESLKKNEEMMTSAASDLEKLERDMAKKEDLSVESQKRLNDEITAARNQIRQKYDELRSRISDHIE
jgi:DNA anti-recombination protein RmuC